MKLMKRRAIIVSFLCLAAIGMANAQNFVAASNYPTGTLPAGSTAADFDNDGNVDVVVGNSGTTTLSLFLGHGDGSLATPSSIQVGVQPLEIAAGDFNGDGNVDLAVSGIGGPFFEVLLGNGDGTFQAPVDIKVPGLTTTLMSPFVISDIAVGDLNSDKKIDIAVATSNGAAVFLNDGAGNFSFAGNVMPGRIVQNLALADLNRDGVLDIVFMLSTGTPNTFLSLGRGDGTFQSPAALPVVTTNPDGIVVADLNNDGLSDVIVDDSGVLGTSPGAIQIALQKPDGTFISAGSLAIPGPTGVVAVDLDGDGNVDIAATTATANGNQNVVEVFRGKGDGTFSAPAQFPVAAGALHPIAAHLTNPTAVDLISSAISANEISVLVNHGANTLTLLSASNPSTIGQPVLLTATITPKFPGSGVFSGSLIFADGSATLGTSTVNSSGSGSLQTTFARVGNHSLQAVFGGNTSFVSSSASITQVVNKASPSVALSSAINPSSFGQSVAFTSASGASGAPVPTGTVNLLDGSSIILTAALDNAGRATLSTSFLSVGSHILTAQYPGDANNTSASSPPLTQTVNKNSSTTTLAAAPNPGTFGQTIAFTTTVSGPGGASGIPTGTVTFSDGNNIIGSSTLDANGKGSFSANSLTVGTHSISAAYAGDTNFSGSASAIVSEVVNKAATATTLTGAPNPSTVGQMVTLTAIVTAPGSGGIPSGAVTFGDGTTAIGTAPLDNAGKATFTVSSLNVGTHSLVATYGGDGNFSGSSSSPTSQVVNKSASVTTLTATPNPSFFGQSITLTAMVASSGSGSAIPTGSVIFVDGTNTIGTAALDKSGKATLAVSSLSVGSHNIGANYGGDGNFSPSSASGAAGVSQVVAQSNTVISISGSPNPSVFGALVTLTASVNATGGGGGVPSGAVTFMDGTVPIGTAPLDSNGNASLNVSSLTVGVHTVTASYPGTADYLPSRSGPLAQTVNRNSVAITLTSAPNPSTFGQAVAFTVKVMPSPPGGAAGTPTPGGTITFSDGTALLGSATLDSTGTATLTINSLTAGSHTITATYGGDANFSKGSSSPYTQTVSQVATKISLASSMNPTTNSSTIILTATVVAAGSTATGSVVFLDGSQQLGSSQIDGTGNAALAVSNLSSGSHTLTASYKGDTNFTSSQSSPLVETVLDSRNSVMLTSSANPQTVSKAVTFTATVATALGGQVTSGTVSFLNGSSLLATIPVANSRASFTTARLPVGNDSITALYQAGPSPSTSDASTTLIETIQQATPTVGGGGNNEDFTLSVKPGSAEIKAGNTLSAQITLTPTNGLTGFVNVACTGVPQGSTCAVTPNLASFDGQDPIKATLVITTTGLGGPARTPHHPPRRGKGGMALLGLFPIAFGCVMIPGLKGKRGSFIAMMLLTGLLVGCGGTTFQNKPIVSNTPPGTYTINIQAESGPLVHSAQMRLTVR